MIKSIKEAADASSKPQRINVILIQQFVHCQNANVYNILLKWWCQGTSELWEKADAM